MNSARISRALQKTRAPHKFVVTRRSRYTHARE